MKGIRGRIKTQKSLNRDPDTVRQDSVKRMNGITRREKDKKEDFRAEQDVGR
jgi:hypothetical protein